MSRPADISLFTVRVLLPIGILIAGVVLLFINGTLALGLALIVIAVLVWFADWLMRLGLSSQDDRDREQWARRYFTRTGRWPRS
jgi:hypothetical protein